MVENTHLAVSVIEDSGDLYVEDKRNGWIWRTYAEEENVAQNLLVQGQTISFDQYIPFEFGWGATFAITIALDTQGPELTMELNADPQLELWDVIYPGVLGAGNNSEFWDLDSARLVLPHNEGLLLPLHENVDKEFPDLRSMEWVGYVDMDSGSGCMTILDTFADIVLRKTDFKDPKDRPTLAY